MMSPKAIAEINKLQDKIEQLTSEIDNLRARQIGADSRSRALLQAGIQQASNQCYSKGKKIESIKKDGVSTSERAKIFAESSAPGSRFIAILRERDIAMTIVEQVGYSKTLESYVLVVTHRYSSIMSNVRGHKSLANKASMHRFARLTEAETDNLLAAGRSITVCFGGKETTHSDISQRAVDLLDDQQKESRAMAQRIAGSSLRDFARNGYGSIPSGL